MYGETYYNMGVMNIPYGNDAAGKFNNAKWYQAICNAAGLVPTGCARSDPPYSYAKAVYGAGEAYGCNPSGSLIRDCGWQNVITFLAPPKDSSDSTENIDAYGLCGKGCTISSTTGWSPICMTAPPPPPPPLPPPPPQPAFTMCNSFWSARQCCYGSLSGPQTGRSCPPCHNTRSVSDCQFVPVDTCANSYMPVTATSQHKGCSYTGKVGDCRFAYYDCGLVNTVSGMRL